MESKTEENFLDEIMVIIAENIVKHSLVFNGLSTVTANQTTVVLKCVVTALNKVETDRQSWKIHPSFGLRCILDLITNKKFIFTSNLEPD